MKAIANHSTTLVKKIWLEADDSRPVTKIPGPAIFNSGQVSSVETNNSGSKQALLSGQGFDESWSLHLFAILRHRCVDNNKTPIPFIEVATALSRGSDRPAFRFKGIAAGSDFGAGWIREDLADLPMDQTGEL